jgi:hypothetical protein
MIEQAGAGNDCNKMTPAMNARTCHFPERLVHEYDLFDRRPACTDLYK